MPENTSSHADPVAELAPEMLEANQLARTELLEALDGLTDEQRRARWYGDERWSLHEIIAHLYEWQNGFAHGLERIARGERPEIPDYDPNQPDDVFNAMVVERNQHLSWEELMAHLYAARERHEAAVKNLVGKVPAERFEPGKTARRLANSATHDHEHIPAILEWRRSG